jgi:hypothetical protein
MHDEAKDALGENADDFLGGEPLEGSGFEIETPEPEFQPEPVRTKERSKGGSR